MSTSNRRFKSINTQKLSEHDDRKTLISSTERYADSTTNRSKRGGNSKPGLKVKRVNKKFDYNTKQPQKESNTPEKHPAKGLENKI